MADETSRELNAADIWRRFEATLPAARRPTASCCATTRKAAASVSGCSSAAFRWMARKRSIAGRGNGLISGVIAALVDSTGPVLDVIDYNEHAIGHGADAQAAAYVECRTADGRTVFGVGARHRHLDRERPVRC